jgi:hypothetical protein
MNVWTTDDTGTPRKCANHTPRGSMDAATKDATSILRGLDGAIIE